MCSDTFELFKFTEKQPRDGRWGAWSKWTNCTRVCGRGKRTRHRFCNKPAPAHGGRDCTGERIQVEPCNTGKCPGNSKKEAVSAEEIPE